MKYAVVGFCSLNSRFRWATALSSLLVTVWTVFPTQAMGAEWQFAPRGRLFRPLLADPGETRLSIVKYLDNNRLEGTIGGSWEAFGVRKRNGVEIRAGIHAGVYALLRKTGATFPLDTADFLFGTHTDLRHGKWSGRFEFAHVSAHQSDGFKDPSRPPRTYSREYFSVYVDHSLSHGRIYGSARLSSHAIPNVKKWRLQFGAEAETPTGLGPLPTVFAAYDLRVFRASGGVFNHTGQLGMKLHSQLGTGLRVAIVGHYGRNEHGQFFDLVDDYIGLGLFFDM